MLVDDMAVALLSMPRAIAGSAGGNGNFIGVLSTERLLPAGRTETDATAGSPSITSSSQPSSSAPRPGGSVTLARSATEDLPLIMFCLIDH